MNIQALVWTVNKPTKCVETDGRLSQYFFNWINGLQQAIAGTLGKGIGATAPVVIPLAKLTGGGANGSITVTNGVITAYLAPT
jgi:hypothetical protein